MAKKKVSFWRRLWGVVSSKRVKSFLWRAVMMGLAVMLDEGVKELGLLEVQNEVTVLVGLALGEVSKYLNNKHRSLK